MRRRKFELLERIQFVNVQESVTRAAVVHLNFRVGSTCPVLVCSVPSHLDRISRCKKVDAVRLYASYRLNLLLLKGQRCVVKERSGTFFLAVEHIKIDKSSREEQDN